MERVKQGILVHKKFLKKILQSQSSSGINLIKSATKEEIHLLYELVSLVLCGSIPISRHNHSSLTASHKIDLLDKFFSTNIRGFKQKKKILLQIQPTLKHLLSALIE